MNRNRQTQSGFTLVELMVVLAIVAVLVVLGAPGLRQYIANQQLSSRANALVMSLNFARGEAVTRNNSEGIYVTPIDNVNNNWSYGWYVWEDARDAQDCGAGVVNDNARSANGCEDLRADASPEGPDGIEITTSPTLNSVHYISSGTLHPSLTAFEFHLCAPDQTEGRIVAVARTGRTSVREKTDCTP